MIYSTDRSHDTKSRFRRLADGRTFLQNRANQIHDPELRRGFLENIPSHQAILSL